MKENEEWANEVESGRVGLQRMKSRRVQSEYCTRERRVLGGRVVLEWE
jgi:hypothetical protein